MPLDRINGEPIDDRVFDATGEIADHGHFYGARYVVIDPSVLFSHDIRVSYELPTPPGKFRSKSRPKLGYRHIVDDVITTAGEHFVKLGAIVPIRGLRIDEDDILVQVYPDLLKVLVLVQRMIAGEEHMLTIPYPRPGEVWPPELIRSLIEASGHKAPVRH